MTRMSRMEAFMHGVIWASLVVAVLRVATSAIIGGEIVEPLGTIALAYFALMYRREWLHNGAPSDGSGEVAPPVR